MVLEETLESPLDCKEIQPVNCKGNKSWIFFGGPDAETETSIWLPNVKNWLIGEDPDAGKDWRQKEKGTTEDKIVEWHHQLDGPEFGQTPGVDIPCDDREAWNAAVHGVTKSWTRLSDWADWAALKDFSVGDLSGGPVVKTLSSQCKGHMFNAQSGN